MKKYIFLMLLVIFYGCGGGSTPNHDNDKLQENGKNSKAKIIGSLDTDGLAMDIVLSSDEKTAYIADFDGGLKIINVEDATNPKLLTTILTGGEDQTLSSGVTISTVNTYKTTIDLLGNVSYNLVSSKNTYAYIVGDFGRLDVVKIDNPNDYKVIGSLSTFNEGNKVTISSDNKTIYVARNSQGVEIVNVQNPQSPKLVKTIKIEGKAFDIELSTDNKTIFIVDEGLEIYKLDQNTSVFYETKGFVSSPTGIDISKDNSIAYVTDTYGGFHTINIADKKPSEISRVTAKTLGIVEDVKISNNQKKAFLACADRGLIVLDITQSIPTIIGTIDTPDWANRIVLSKDNTKAYIADNESGLQIIDISEFKY